MVHRKIRIILTILTNLLVFAIIVSLPGALQSWVNKTYGSSPLDNPIWIPMSIGGLVVFLVVLFYTIAWCSEEKRSQ